MYSKFISLIYFSLLRVSLIKVQIFVLINSVNCNHLMNNKFKYFNWKPNLLLSFTKWLQFDDTTQPNPMQSLQVRLG
jgi:hypothetical protein